MQFIPPQSLRDSSPEGGAESLMLTLASWLPLQGSCQLAELTEGRACIGWSFCFAKLLAHTTKARPLLGLGWGSFTQTSYSALPFSARRTVRPIFHKNILQIPQSSCLLCFIIVYLY